MYRTAYIFLITYMISEPRTGLDSFLTISTFLSIASHAALGVLNVGWFTNSSNVYKQAFQMSYRKLQVLTGQDMKRVGFMESNQQPGKMRVYAEQWSET
jgi:hypothetical protein